MILIRLTKTKRSHENVKRQRKCFTETRQTKVDTSKLDCTSSVCVSVVSCHIAVENYFFSINQPLLVRILTQSSLRSRTLATASRTQRHARRLGRHELVQAEVHAAKLNAIFEVMLPFTAIVQHRLADAHVSPTHHCFGGLISKSSALFFDRARRSTRDMFHSLCELRAVRRDSLSQFFRLDFGLAKIRSRARRVRGNLILVEFYRKCLIWGDSSSFKQSKSVNISSTCQYTFNV